MVTSEWEKAPGLCSAAGTGNTQRTQHYSSETVSSSRKLTDQQINEQFVDKNV